MAYAFAFSTKSTSFFVRFEMAADNCLSATCFGSWEHTLTILIFINCGYGALIMEVVVEATIDSFFADSRILAAL
jgi:hypothetical protein